MEGVVWVPKLGGLIAGNRAPYVPEVPYPGKGLLDDCSALLSRRLEVLGLGVLVGVTMGERGSSSMSSGWTGVRDKDIVEW